MLTYSYTQIHVSRDSDDEDTGVKEWLKGSKSYDELSDFRDEEDHQRVVSRGKKSRTSKFISRFFKHKTMTPRSTKRSKGGNMPNRDSSISNRSSMNENRENCLTASVSMPDITGEL